MATSGGVPGPRPPIKPYQAYTIFFRLESAHILESSGIVSDEVISAFDPHHEDTIEFPRPDRYATLILPPFWYSSKYKAAVERRRKHRKREGRMDLKALSKIVSARWKKVDPDILKYVHRLAKWDSDRYDMEVAEQQPGGATSGGPKKQRQKTSAADGTVISNQDVALPHAFQPFSVMVQEQLRQAQPSHLGMPGMNRNDASQRLLLGMFEMQAFLSTSIEGHLPSLCTAAYGQDGCVGADATTPPNTACLASPSSSGQKRKFSIQPTDPQEFLKAPKGVTSKGGANNHELFNWEDGISGSGGHHPAPVVHTCNILPIVTQRVASIPAKVGHTKRYVNKAGTSWREEEADALLGSLAYDPLPPYDEDMDVKNSAKAKDLGRV